MMIGITKTAHKYVFFLCLVLVILVFIDIMRTSRMESTSVDLGFFYIGDEISSEQIETIAISKLSSIINKTTLFPTKQAVNIKWVERHVDTNIYRTIKYTHGNFDRLSDITEQKQNKYIIANVNVFSDVSPEIIERLSQTAASRNINIDELLQYGCSVKRFNQKDPIPQSF